MTIITFAVFTLTAVACAVAAYRMQPTAKGIEAALSPDRKRRAMVNCGDPAYKAFKYANLK
jgi:hypothetical protein